MGLVTAAPFLSIFSQNGLQNGGPFFRKFAERVVLRWLKTIPQAKNLENKGYRKGSRFGTSFGTSFGWNLNWKSWFLGRCLEPFGITIVMVFAFWRVQRCSSQRNRFGTHFGPDFRAHSGPKIPTKSSGGRPRGILERPKRPGKARRKGSKNGPKNGSPKKRLEVENRTADSLTREGSRSTGRDIGRGKPLP